MILERICQFCGKSFEGAGGRRKFCSEACCTKYHNKRVADLNHANRIIVNVKCTVCGKEFPQKTTRHRYCSKECSEKNHYNQYKRYGYNVKENNDVKKNGLLASLLFFYYKNECLPLSVPVEPTSANRHTIEKGCEQEVIHRRIGAFLLALKRLHTNRDYIEKKLEAWQATNFQKGNTKK